MKIKIILFAILLFSANLVHSQNSVTDRTNEIIIPSQSSDIITNSYYRKANNQSFKKIKRISKESDFNIHIPAGESILLEYNAKGKYVHQYAIHHYDSLTWQALEAIEKAPDWLKNDLRDVLVQLDKEFQNKWSEYILQTKDPYVDEIIFSIANLSPTYLSSEYAYKKMFDINAEYIYKYDSILNYVEVVDYGSAANGGNYYSTTKYKQKDSLGNIYETEIPKEIYYWYVVHPKITDEIPGFVEPSKVEKDHKEVMTDPDNGFFWREYVLEHNDAGIPNESFGAYQTFVDTNSRITASGYSTETEYQALAHHVLDTLSVATYIWDKETTGGSSNLMKFDYVIAILERYVNSCMHFWSTPQERPHQPIRILKWGVGRCGEHEDISAAVGRAALIPSSGIEASSSDHVWNGFFIDDDWHSWEAVGGLINRGYPDGDGNRWASVNLRRSDGITDLDVVDMFSNQSGTINVHVVDKWHKPIDGATVTLFAKHSSNTNIYYDNVRITDQNGLAEFTVGNDRIYYCRVYALGKQNPAGNYVDRLTNPVVPDRVYNSTVRFSDITIDELDDFVLNNLDTITNNSTDTFMSFDFEITDEYIYGGGSHDDMGSIQVREHRKTNAGISFFELSENNFNKMLTTNNPDAFNIKENILSLDTNVAVSCSNNSFFVIRNTNMQNFINITGEIALLMSDDKMILDIGVHDTIFNPSLRKKPMDVVIGPNPTNNLVTIKLNNKNLKSITVYDMLGKLVNNIENISSNQYTLKLFSEHNGIYIIKIIDENNEKIIKKVFLNNQI